MTKSTGRPKDSRKTYSSVSDARKGAKTKGQPPSDVYKVKGGYRIKKPRKKTTSRKKK